MVDRTYAEVVTFNAKAGISRARTIFGGAIGHFVEWFEFSMYGLLAPYFSQQMFPMHDKFLAILTSFSIFAVGYLARPLGAIILSPLADTMGRKTLLSYTILMAGAGSAMIALTPSYDQIGIAAPILMTVARILQGFSAGGEFQTAVTFLNESSSSRNRAFSASFQMLCIGLSILCSTALVTVMTSTISHEAVSQWGWRIPFGLGALLSVVGIFIRNRLPESPVFEHEKAKSHDRDIERVHIFARHAKEIMLVFVIQMNSVPYVLVMIFFPTYVRVLNSADHVNALALNLVATAVFCVSIPALAWLSDRIGRKPFLIAPALVFTILPYPVLNLLGPNVSSLTTLLIVCGGAVAVGSTNAVFGTVVSELFPTSIRATAIGIPYAISSALFAGTAPIVATSLFKAGGNTFVAAYLSAIGAISLVLFIFVLPETYGRSLESEPD
ncbi:MFS transporter [Paraburkholderia sediminicola]|uniref:MFS transporter n=1 Tax=Paraburkholderia sediminicola TaxID=458836 RepID=UPI0038B6BE6E